MTLATRTTTALAALAAAAALSACGASTAAPAPADTKPAASKTPKPQPSPVEMKPVTGMLLSGARAIDGPSLIAYDAGPTLNGTNERAVLDGSNWVIIAQCPTSGAMVPAKESAKVYVLKRDELTSTQRGKATNGKYQSLFTC